MDAEPTSAGSSGLPSQSGCGFRKRGDLGLPVSAVQHSGCLGAYRNLVGHSSEAQARARNPLTILLEDLPNFADEVGPCLQNLHSRLFDRDPDKADDPLWLLEQGSHFAPTIMGSTGEAIAAGAFHSCGFETVNLLEEQRKGTGYDRQLVVAEDMTSQLKKVLGAPAVLYRKPSGGGRAYEKVEFKSTVEKLHTEKGSAHEDRVNWMVTHAAASAAQAAIWPSARIVSAIISKPIRMVRVYTNLGSAVPLSSKGIGRLTMKYCLGKVNEGVSLPSIVECTAAAAEDAHAWFTSCKAVLPRRGSPSSRTLKCQQLQWVHVANVQLPTHLNFSSASPPALQEAKRSKPSPAPNRHLVLAAIAQGPTEPHAL